MPSVFHFSESNLVGEVETLDVANVNFGSIDAAELIPVDNPVVCGDDSFEKYIRIKFTGTWTEISNMKFWKLSGAYVTDELIKAAANVAYVQPSDVANADSAIPIVLGSALSIQSAEGDATIEYGVSGVTGYTKYIRMQTHSTVSTPAGAGASKVLCFQFDES